VLQEAAIGVSLVPQPLAGTDRFNCSFCFEAIGSIAWAAVRADRRFRGAGQRPATDAVEKTRGVTCPSAPVTGDCLVRDRLAPNRSAPIRAGNMTDSASVTCAALRQSKSADSTDV
jgi:hypothetical protein